VPAPANPSSDDAHDTQIGGTEREEVTASDHGVYSTSLSAAPAQMAGAPRLVVIWWEMRRPPVPIMALPEVVRYEP
jgi:hypothetical protein